MSYKDVMDVILPPNSGKEAHITGYYGERREKGPHGGSDFNYSGGQAGINLRHPVVHSPVAGEVVFVGGRYGTVTIRDRDGNEHKLLHMHTQTVREHQQVEAGTQIGTMGGRGPGGANDYAQHVHYQMKDRDGVAINPEAYWAHRGKEGPVRQAAGPGLLRNGDGGEPVRMLQSTLSKLGYCDSAGRPLRVDGDFGDRTESAVRVFQRAHGLRVDGQVGADTRKALAHAGTTPLLSERTYPDHAFFLQAKGHLAQLRAGNSAGEDGLDRAAAALAASARLAGLRRIDQVMPNARGDGFIALQGEPRDPGRHLASVATEDAAQSIERSTARLAQEGPPRPHGQAPAQLEHLEHRAGSSFALRP